MNRELILEQLTQTERNIGAGECEAARLWQHITRLERAGEGAAEVRQALQTHERLQAAQKEERTRLLAELSMLKAA